jgi:hypothetical protein
VKVIVGFSYGNHLISRIIKWFIDSDVSHTYIKIKGGLMGSDVAFHADPIGVVVHLEEVFDVENNVVEEYEIEDIRVEQSITRNLRHLGKKYHYWKLLNWAWVLTFRRWVKMKIQNPTEDPSKLICVDLVIRILNGAGVTQLECGTMKPNDLREWVRNNHEQLGWKRVR